MDNVQSNAIEIIDRNGWSKKYPLPPKPIIHLGSNAENDIILTGTHGTGVAPLHAQIITPGANRAGYQLVNLSETEIILNAPEVETLPSRTAMVVIGGSSFTVGDFTLIFHGGEGYYGGPIGRRTPNIGLQLQLSHMQVGPGQAFDATVLVQNLGPKTGVQFDLELEGLDDDCFDLEPGPLLSSGAGKEMKLRIYHRGPKPGAGNCQVMVRAAAPRAYPGEMVIVTQTIEILPYYRHHLGFLAPAGAGKKPRIEGEELLPKAETVLPPQRSAAPVPYQAGGVEWWGGGVPALPTGTVPASDAVSVTPVEESTDWWSAPPEPAQPEDSTAAAGAVVAAAGAAAVAASLTGADTDNVDWWSAPQEAASGTAAETAASKTAPQPDTADWWSTPAATEEAAPTASPIPATTDVPRQADDGWAAGTTEKPPSQAAPSTPTQQSSGVDDWWATPPDSDSAEVPESQSASTWVAEPESPPPAPSGSDVDDWWATPPKQSGDSAEVLTAGKSAAAWSHEISPEPPTQPVVAPPPTQFGADTAYWGDESSGSSTPQMPDSIPAPPPDEWWASGPAPAPPISQHENLAESPVETSPEKEAVDSPSQLQAVEKSAETVDAKADAAPATAGAAAAVTAAAMQSGTASAPSTETRAQSETQPAQTAEASPVEPEPDGLDSNETLASATPPPTAPETETAPTAAAPVEAEAAAAVQPSAPAPAQPPAEKTEKSGGFWSSMKAGVAGMAVALRRKSRAESEGMPAWVEDDASPPEMTKTEAPPSVIAEKTDTAVEELPPETAQEQPEIIISPTPAASTVEAEGIEEMEPQATVEPPPAPESTDELQTDTAEEQSPTGEPAVTAIPEAAEDNWWTDDDAWATASAPSPVEQPAEAITENHPDRMPAESTPPEAHLPTTEGEAKPAPPEAEHLGRESDADSDPATDNWWQTGSGMGALHTEERATHTWGSKEAWPPLVPGAEVASSAEDWWLAEPEPPPKSKEENQKPQSEDEA